MAYIKPTGKQLFQRYNQPDGKGNKSCEWAVVVICLIPLAAIGLGVIVNSRKKQEQFTIVLRQQEHMNRKRSENEERISRVESEVKSQKESIRDLNNKVEEMETTLLSESDPWA